MAWECFRITGPLWGKTTGDFRSQRSNNGNPLCFLAIRLNKLPNKQPSFRFETPWRSWHVTLIQTLMKTCSPGWAGLRLSGPEMYWRLGQRRSNKNEISIQPRSTHFHGATKLSHEFVIHVGIHEKVCNPSVIVSSYGERGPVLIWKGIKIWLWHHIWSFCI